MIVAIKHRYALIGSRRAPDWAANLLMKLAYMRAKRGCHLGCSGGAPVMDESLEFGVWTYLIESNRTHLSKKYLRVYLPASEFNGRYHWPEGGYLYLPKTLVRAKQQAEKFHPAWHRLYLKSQAKIARNSFQILGKSLANPVSEVVCYTPDGSLGDKTSPDTGGTGQALRVAYAHRIPIINIQRDAHRRYIETLVRGIELPFDISLKQLKQFRGYNPS